MIDGYEDIGFRTVELNGVTTSKLMTSFELELIGEIDRLRSANAVLNYCIKVLEDQNNKLLSDQDRLTLLKSAFAKSRNGVSLDFVDCDGVASVTCIYADNALKG